MQIQRSWSAQRWWMSWDIERGSEPSTRSSWDGSSGGTCTREISAWLVGVFVVAEQHLVQFLVGAQACEDDVDVAAGACDEVLRHVEDLDRFAHVEDEHVGGLADCPGLDGEFAGLGDGHEVAGHVGVGDRNWATGVDLAGEGVQHGAARA